MGLKLESSWVEALQEELQKPYIKELKQFLNEESERGAETFPPEDQVFNAFLQTPFSRVKVVIMGQDPYHGPNQAHGLCFSVQKGINPPPSLKNIYKELEADLGIQPPEHGSLLSWARQGVLLLNATLTVLRSAPRSHYGKGWERFTDRVIEMLAEREDPIVFILWGKSAQEKCELVLSKKNHSHLILKCAHPSPYSATGFFGCRHFSKANTFLKEHGKEPIDWRLE